MSPKASVRIVIAQTRAPQNPLPIHRALERLGRGVETELVHDADRCIERCRVGDVDLVVCEWELGADCERILDTLRASGPPVVVAGRDRGDDAALDAFRRGAADFVAWGDGFAEALPMASLEQIRGWRAVRGLEQLQRKVLQTEKLASLGQLAAGMAHEINNPIGFIHANLFQMSEYVVDLRRMWERVGVLQQAVEKGDLEGARRASADYDRLAAETDVPYLLSDLGDAIRESQEGAERVRHIVQDLRDFSRQDTGEHQRADVNECLDSTANIVWPLMKHVAVLEKDYHDIPVLRCNPMQLKQIFMNLLMNAYQAIETRVANSGETGRIVIRSEVRDDIVAISFRDDGCGIPPEHFDRIFDPFFTTKKIGAGTGLGLSTSFGIAENHGGTILAESVLGEGSTFEVVLPLDAADAPGRRDGSRA